MSEAERAKPATEPGKPGAVDPSMEDILASIRRILAEEETAPVPPPAGDAVLQLDASMLVAETPPAMTSFPEPVPPMSEPTPFSAPPADPLADPLADPMAAEMPAYAAPLPDAPLPLPGLVDPAAAAAAASSVGSLVRTLMVERGTQVHSAGPTLEDIVRSELRPLLKDWLDVYLPPLVERLVRVEIERVVGRAVP
jgi:hypothetical protein